MRRYTCTQIFLFDCSGRVWAIDELQGIAIDDGVISEPQKGSCQNQQSKICGIRKCAPLFCQEHDRNYGQESSSQEPPIVSRKASCQNASAAFQQPPLLVFQGSFQMLYKLGK